MIILNRAEDTERLTEAIKEVAGRTLQESKNYIEDIMMNGEHKLTTIMDAIRYEQEEILNYMIGNGLYSKIIKVERMRDAVECLLFNHALQFARELKGKDEIRTI